MSTRQLARISKAQEGYKVIYTHRKTFYKKMCASLIEAIKWAESELKTPHDEVILSISI